ncbi:hypothetical protein IEC97_07260 [Neobacillus cucumis]|uniref:hypothetical protein n=1 Tax=Neobacillus cucumis TaxID=1740721 RepID=UPI0018E05EBD|nr:hypothetical protein [Neobacillus cucumis]MBI0577155.1 hypothetical protein [Neobacillus cucumis]
MNLIKFLVRTQVMAIIVGVLRIIYLYILAFLDQPDRALQYINWFVYGLAIVFGILAFYMTRYFLGRKWLEVLLVLISYLITYPGILVWFFQKGLIFSGKSGESKPCSILNIFAEHDII